jgi:hypothetical protein
MLPVLMRIGPSCPRAHNKLSTLPSSVDGVVSGSMSEQDLAHMTM